QEYPITFAVPRVCAQPDTLSIHDQALAHGFSVASSRLADIKFAHAAFFLYPEKLMLRPLRPGWHVTLSARIGGQQFYNLSDMHVFNGRTDLQDWRRTQHTPTV